MKMINLIITLTVGLSASEIAESHGTSVPEKLPQMTSEGTTNKNIDSLKIDKFGDKVQRQFINGEKGMLAWFYLKADADVPWHSHESEQISYVIEGEMIITVGTDEKSYHLKEGDVLVIPAHVPHKGHAIKNTVEIDVFSPIRQDWLDGTDQYLQGIE